MSKNWKLFLFVGATIIMAGLGAIFLMGNNKEESDLISSSGSGNVAGAISSQDDYISRLARHLRESSMVLYGTDQSVETKEQKKLFGEAVSLIDYVDCDVTASSSNPDECIGHNISIYPTWVYEGQKFEGFRTLSELIKITNFEQ